MSQHKPKLATPFTFKYDEVATGTKISGHPMPEDGELEHLTVYAQDAPIGTDVVFLLKTGGGDAYLNVASRISGGKAEFGKLPVQKGDQIVCEVQGPEGLKVGQLYITYMLVQ